MELLTGIFSAFGLSASAGLNAYIPLLVIALISRFTDLINLSEPWNALESWWIIGLLGLLSLIEFFADKFPAVNHVNDAIQTLVRPTAGAIVFAASARVITDVNPSFSLALGLLVAGGVHAAKAAFRPAVTATTAGVGNPVVSTIEDVIAAVTSLLAILIPWLVALVAVIGIVMFLRWRIKRQERRAANP
jgi:hypothetical protein